MNLPFTGREYINFEISEADTGTITVSFDAGLNWNDVERISATELRVLVAGPGATGNPVGTVVLPVGFYGMFLKLVDGSQDVYRTAGSLTVDSDIG